jgi:hypothetical protein
MVLPFSLMVRGYRLPQVQVRGHQVWLWPGLVSDANLAAREPERFVRSRAAATALSWIQAVDRVPGRLSRLI